MTRVRDAFAELGEKHEAKGEIEIYKIHANDLDD
jgi:hypothetical protein